MAEFDNPAKSSDPEVVRAYLVGLGFEPDEIESIVPNWTRTEPQTMEEVRAGIKWEREGREALSDRCASQHKPKS